MEDKFLVQEKPNFYERLGLWYFRKLSEKDKQRGRVAPPRNDAELVRASLPL
jgi:hypothetical protein